MAKQSPSLDHARQGWLVALLVRNSPQWLVNEAHRAGWRKGKAAGQRIDALKRGHRDVDLRAHGMASLKARGMPASDDLQNSVPNSPRTSSEPWA